MTSVQSDRKITSSIRIDRKDDRGDPMSIELQYIEGMPDMFCITQTTVNETKKIEFTPIEAKLVRYSMGEFERFLDLKKQYEKGVDDDEY